MFGGIFDGAGGDDVVQSSLFSTATWGGTFNGGAGDDTADVLGDTATFNGGRDIDRVTGGVHGAAALNGGADNDTAGDVSGTFNGGRGDDRAQRSVGTVAGGPGDDAVAHLCSGVFHGGPGYDSAGVQEPRWSPAPEAYSVENQSPNGSC